MGRNKDCRRCGQPRPPDAEVCFLESDKPTYLKRHNDEAIPVEQSYVGYLIGPHGETLRKIKDTSGAKIVIDQDDRDMGYSIIRIGDAGSLENYKAKQMIEDKIKECHKLSQNRPKVVAPPDASSELPLPQAPPLPPPPPPALMP